MHRAGLLLLTFLAVLAPSTTLAASIFSRVPFTIGMKIKEHRCGVAIENNNTDAILKACDPIIAKGGKEAQKAYRERGDAHRDQGDLLRAITDYGQAIKLDGRDQRAYVGRCRAYSMRGEHSRAIADCDEAIRIDPKSAYVYSARGSAHTAKGELRLAIADLDKAIELDASGVYYEERGRIYEKAGEAARARTNLDAAAGF